MKKYLIGISLLLGHNIVFGQIFYSDGATITIEPNTIVYSNGGIELNSSTDFTNDGFLTVTKNSTLPIPGTFKIGNGTNVKGSGSYSIEQDWINDGNFIADNSQVILYGNTQQFITSNNSISTIFNNLILTGIGTGNNRRKTLQNVNASTSATGTLNINDRELETQSNSFFVLNKSNAAILYSNAFGTEGFVSSIVPGFLSRETNATSTYIFPTGSSYGTLRFRPIEITPKTNSSTQYTVRFNNYDANVDGYDRDITDGKLCALNPLWYHTIERPNGTASADMGVYFLITNDGNWNGVANWNASWNDMSVTSTAGAGSFTKIIKSDWNFTDTQHQYILAGGNLPAPTLICPDMCENSKNNVFTVTNGTGNYEWIFPENATIISGEGTSSVIVDWKDGTGEVSVVDLGTGACISEPAICIPTINEAPEISFSYNGDKNTPSIVNFVNTTSGAEYYSWFFGDGGTSNISNPVHEYPEGGTDYSVILYATSPENCIDSFTSVITIEESLLYFVPNTFTPNADQRNNIFLPIFANIDIQSYTMLIFNRWGEMVFETHNPEVGWDGTYGEKLCQDGTYTYKITLKQNNRNDKVELTGNVYLLK